MKNTIKIFMIAAALFISGNLFAQSITDYQNRLHDLQLCQNYFSTILSAQQMIDLNKEIDAIQQKLANLNASPLAATNLDNDIQQHPKDEDVMAYIKILATYTEPLLLLGHDITPAQRSSYETNLSSRAATISAKF